MDAKFVVPDGGKFQDRYQRNNKKGGIKNLKCFPLCSNAEHRKGAPCTGPVIVSVSGKLSDPKGSLLAYARFRLESPEADETWESDLIMYVPGEKYSRLELDMQVRTRKNQHGKEFLGDATLKRSKSKPNKVSATVEFKERGWHYGWTGGRYKTGQKHYLEVNFFEESASSPDTLTHIGLLESSRFGVFSSRRSNPNDKLKRRVKNKADKMDTIKEKGKSDKKKDKKKKSKKDKKKKKDDLMLAGDTDAVDTLLNELIDMEDCNIPFGGYEDDDMMDDGSEIGSDEDFDDIDLALYLGEISSPMSIMDGDDGIIEDVARQVIKNNPNKTHKPIDAPDMVRVDIKPVIVENNANGLEQSQLDPVHNLPDVHDLPELNVEKLMNIEHRPQRLSTEKNVATNMDKISDVPPIVRPQPVQVVRANAAPPSSKVTTPPKRKSVSGSRKVQESGSGLRHLQKDVPLDQLHDQSRAPSIRKDSGDKKVGVLTKLFRTLTCG